MSCHKPNYCPITGNPCNNSKEYNVWVITDENQKEYNLCQHCFEHFFYDKIHKRTVPTPASMLNSLIEMLASGRTPEEFELLESLENESRQKEMEILQFIEKREKRVEELLELEHYEFVPELQEQILKITSKYKQIQRISDKIQEAIKQKDFQKIEKLKKLKIEIIDNIFKSIKK